MNSKPLSIFISYASYDNQSENPEEQWLNRLLQFLKPLELEKKISCWSDTELSPGSDWQSDIKAAIETANVAVLLVSPAFLASEFIRTEELPRLLKKLNFSPPSDAETLAEGLLILPILLRPCLIDMATFEIGDGDKSKGRLSDFQYVPKGRAMNGLSQYEQDKQLEFIARSIDDSQEKQITKPSLTATSSETGLDKLLEDFLEKYPTWWFNATRIKNLGGQQPEFENLNDFSPKQIRYRLQAMENAKTIESKEGTKSMVYKTKKKKS